MSNGSNSDFEYEEFDGDYNHDLEEAWLNDLPDEDEVPDELAMVTRFLLDGYEKAAANLLLSCECSFSSYSVSVSAPRKAYDVLTDETHPVTRAVHRAFYAVNGFTGANINVTPKLAPFTKSDWRSEALALISTLDGPHNQAAEEWDKPLVTWQHLRFRSNTEVRIAQALDAAGVLFLPNCRGRVGPSSNRRSIESDFLVLHKGRFGILEVDGPHHNNAAAKDHDRDSLFFYHGVTIVRHFEASRCYKEPDVVVKEFLNLLEAAIS